MMHIDQKWRNRFSKGTYYASFIFFAFSFSYIAFATPPASPYTPGATLNPGCTPGSANCTVSVLPSGSTGEVQFNLSGAFAGSPSFFWDNTNKRLGIGTTSPSAKLEINGTTTPTGVELVTNGTFTGSAAGWTLGGEDAEYSANAVTVTHSSGDPNVSTNIVTESGKTYLLTFTLSGVSGDTVTYSFDNNGETFDEGPFGNGVHTVTFNSDYTGTDTIWFQANDWNVGGAWTIDNVSIKELPAVSPALKVIGFNGDTVLSLGGDILGNTAVGLSALSSSTTGYRNTANGMSALRSNTTGYQNTANGASALRSNTTGTYNTANGVNALYSNIDGTYNTANGVNALYSNIDGSSNTANGVQALYSNTTGYGNTANGVNALFSNTTGNYNTANGVNALYSNTTGTENTANGASALSSNTTGTENTASGVNALYSNTTGTENTANGSNALLSNTTGDSNTANGVNALFSNTTGYQNTANGVNALFSNTTGDSNTANGNQSLYSNTTGIFNTANGNQSLYSNTTGIFNTANGNQSLYSNTTGYDNTANGHQSLYYNTTGYGNTANGMYALRSNTTGYENTANGGAALYDNTTGYRNTANGFFALRYNTTGTYNTANGAYALYSNTAGLSNTANGSNALLSNTTGYYNTANGSSALYFNTTGTENTANGRHALYYNTTGNYNTANGASALYSNTTGTENTASGVNALYLNTTGYRNTANGMNALAVNTTGYENTANGVQALNQNTTGYQNTANGGSALYENTTGYDNTASGFFALRYNTTGFYNTANGARALQANTTGYYNTANGVNALYSNTTGYDNTASGYASLYNNTTGNYNTANGMNALNYNTTGTSSTAVGYQAGSSNTTGYQNTFLGMSAGFTDGTIITTADLFNATAIGYNAQVTRNNSLILGGTGTYGVNVGIGTTSPDNVLSVASTSNATFHINSISTSVDGWISRYDNRLQINGSDALSLGAGNQTNSHLWITNTGKVGIGTTSPWRTLAVTGTVGFDGLTGAIGAGSLCLDANKQVVYNSGTDACLSSTRATKHDIETLSFDALAVIDALDPVSFVYNEGNGRTRYGFIAEDTAAVLASLATYNDEGGISGIDDRAVLSVAVKAIQEQEIKISDIETFIGASDSQSFTERVVSALASFGVEIADTFVRVKKLIVRDEVCINATCINEEQLKTLLENAGFSGTPTEQPPTEPDPVVDTESPTITLVGNNPATIQTGETYADLGATVSDNVNQNLGYTISVDGGTPIDPSALSLDTSLPITYTLTFTATDQAGNTGTTARTIIVEDPSSLPI